MRPTRTGGVPPRRKHHKTSWNVRTDCNAAGKLILRNSRHHRALCSLGVLMFDTGRIEESSRYLERAVEIEPDPKYLTHLGEIYRRHSELEVSALPALNLGLPELVANSEDGFVETAVALARDLERLSRLRAELRSRLETSPLGDAPRFARQIEAAYRTVWRRYCGTSDGARSL